MKCIIAVGFALLKIALGFSESQITDSVERACNSQQYMCPNPEYGLFGDRYRWAWDMQAVLQSPVALELRKARFADQETFKVLRKTFCCTFGPCLAKCGIFPRIEISLIKTFPDNSDDLSNMDTTGLEGFEKFRPHLRKWALKHPKGILGKVDADVDDFKDYLFENQDLINERLRELKSSQKTDNS